MVIVAAMSGGRVLERELPVDDPVFPNLRRALKASDVQLFWAYEAPESLHISRWSGGWILIPQQK